MFSLEVRRRWGKLRQMCKCLMGGDEEGGTRKRFFRCILGLIPPVVVAFLIQRLRTSRGQSPGSGYRGASSLCLVGRRKRCWLHVRVPSLQTSSFPQL